MTNNKKPPTLIHKGNKGDGIFYKLPQNVIDIIFNKLDGKNGNAIKLMIVLLGTCGDGSFSISEKFIYKHTGMAKQNYHRTLKNLIDLGFVTVENKTITINIENILNIHHDDSQSNHQNNNSNHDDDSKGNHDDDYNIKEYKNNIKYNIKENELIDGGEIDSRLSRIFLTKEQIEDLHSGLIFIEDILNNTNTMINNFCVEEIERLGADCFFIKENRRVFSYNSNGVCMSQFVLEE